MAPPYQEETAPVKTLRADYLTLRAIEKELRRTFNAATYRPMTHDREVADQVANRLRHPVSIASVSNMRNRLGMFVREGRPWAAPEARGLTLTHKEHMRLRQALSESKSHRVVVRKCAGGAAYITTLETYHTVSNGMKKRKPWTKVKHRSGGRRKRS